MENTNEITTSTPTSITPFQNFEIYLQELGLPSEGIIVTDTKDK